MYDIAGYIAELHQQAAYGVLGRRYEHVAALGDRLGVDHVTVVRDLGIRVVYKVKIRTRLYNIWYKIHCYNTKYITYRRLQIHIIQDIYILAQITYTST